MKRSEIPAGPGPKWIAIVISAMLILMALWVLENHAKAAEPIPDAEAIRCIVGEAGNQGAQGMIYLASALHNRGRLTGVYGCQDKVWEQAAEAWKEAKTKDSVQGATGWGTDKDIKKFKKSGWWKKQEVILKYKKHTFYKELLNGK